MKWTKFLRFTLQGILMANICCNGESIFKNETVPWKPALVSINYEPWWFQTSLKSKVNNNFKIYCVCYGGHVSLVGPNGNEYATETCNSSGINSSVVELTPKTLEKVPFGRYQCKQGAWISDESFNYQYRICDPKSAECQTECQDSRPRVCVHNEQYPEGKSCVSLLNVTDSDATPPDRQHFCPGNFTSWAEAVEAGLEQIESFSSEPCKSHDDSYHFELDGNKLYFMAIVVVENYQANYTFKCPANGNRRYNLAKVSYLSSLIEQNINVTDETAGTDQICFYNSTLTEAIPKLESLAPLLLYVYGSFDKMEMFILNRFVVFLDKLDLTFKKMIDNDTALVAIQAPSNIDEAFQLSITAYSNPTADGQQNNFNVNKFDISVPISQPVTVRLEQKFVSCIPQSVHRAKVLKRKIRVNVDHSIDIIDIADTTNSTTGRTNATATDESSIDGIDKIDESTDENAAGKGVPTAAAKVSNNDNVKNGPRSDPAVIVVIVVIVALLLVTIGVSFCCNTTAIKPIRRRRKTTLTSVKSLDSSKKSRSSSIS